MALPDGIEPYHVVCPHPPPGGSTFGHSTCPFSFTA